MAKDVVATLIRLPKALHTQVTKDAEQKNVSFNSEVINSLQHSRLGWIGALLQQVYGQNLGLGLAASHTLAGLLTLPREQKDHLIAVAKAAIEAIPEPKERKR